MRTEVGRTRGVKQWTQGQPYTTIVCTQGHKKRTIDRIRWAGPNARGMYLYTSAFRLDDLFGHDPGTSAEEWADDFKWRLRCPCGLDVTMTSATLEKVAKSLHEAGVSRFELSRLAAILS